MAAKLHASPPLSELELRRRARNVALAVLYGAHSESDPDLLAALAEDDECPDPPHFFDPAAWPLRPTSTGPEPDPLESILEAPSPSGHDRDRLTEQEHRELLEIFDRERRERHLLPS
jgi:hypothetical protein